MREQLVGAAEVQAASRRWGHWRWAFTIEQDFPSWVWGCRRRLRGENSMCKGTGACFVSGVANHPWLEPLA